MDKLIQIKLICKIFCRLKFISYLCEVKTSRYIINLLNFLIMSDENWTKKHWICFIIAAIIIVAVIILTCLFPEWVIGVGVFIAFLLNVLGELCNGRPLR